MTAPSIFADRRVVIAIALLCCLLWGSAVPAVKVGYTMLAISPADTGSLLYFAGIRFVIAGLMLLAWAGLTGKSIALDRRGVGEVSVLGLISTAAQYLFYYVGLAHSTGVKVSITTSTSTFFSVVLAHFLYAGDRLTWRRVVGVVFGFLGVVAVNLSPHGLDFAFALLGEGFIVVAALLFAVASIVGKRISQHMDVTVMTGWQLAIGGLVLAIAGFAMGGHLGAIDWQDVLLIAYLAALSAAAFSLWALLMQHNPVGVVAIFNSTIPLFGVTLSALLLGDPLFEWKNLAALALVVSGIWLVTATKPPQPA